ncbi:RNA-binding S4 domain-containing protein [Streptomyces caeni]|uniref:RNA-binding S4 domain-containing protein n=1 Tax=Streptomyces caeni TaxID=2307231 RepID=A0ABW4IL95_9ACTN
MAAEGADDEKTAGAGGTGAAATDRGAGARRAREADRREAGAGEEERASDAHGAARAQAGDLRSGGSASGDTGTTGMKAGDAKIAAAAAGPSNGESVRVDSWIWSVRLVKTRSIGAAACRGGHVRVNGERVKPAYSVRVGDEVRLRHEGRERVVVVTRLIRKRVGAPVAVQCYVDNSPPPPPREAVAPAGVRDRGMGRPTKRDRREMERLRGLGAAPGSPSAGLGHGAPGRPGGQSRTGGQGRPGGRGRSNGRNGPGGL